MYKFPCLVFPALVAALVVTSIQGTDAAAEESNVIEEIIVVAPRIVPRIVRDRTRIGVASAVVYELDARVNIADLDLSRSADVLEVEGRIQEAATQICEDLASQHPQGSPRMSVCIQRAADDAMGQVQALVRELANQ